MTPVSGKTRLRVLVADDEKVITDTLRVILEQNGFETATAYCGAVAIETARTWQPDLFLSDVLMPDMNGIEAAIRICELLPECRVLLLSGAGATWDLLDQAHSRGFHFSLVLKPIHPTRLLRLLHGLAPTTISPLSSQQLR